MRNFHAKAAGAVRARPAGTGAPPRPAQGAACRTAGLRNSPSTHQWQTPSGRVYAQAPKRYPV